MKEYDWVQPTLERISDLLRMPDVHNSYGAPKVDPSLAVMVLRVMLKFPRLPVPQVLCTREGGFDFLWRGVATECFLVTHLEGSTVSMTNTSGSKNYRMDPEKALEAELAQISRELAPETQAP
jgi:hypothetical protein